MGMVVRSNLTALNANRQLGVNNSKVAKSLEKLSSGFRINRAGDDASGLAISEKMKAQIKGLEQASSNAQDGISLVQTAEGAMTEVHNMLNRMVELATKSSNGTISDDVDRPAIQDEVDQLKEEINRIADSTTFNNIKLLNGNLEGAASDTPTASVFTSGSVALGTASAQQMTVSLSDGSSVTVDYTSTAAANTNATNMINALNGKAELNGITFAGDENGITATSDTAGAAALSVTSLTTDDATGTIAAGSLAKGADSKTGELSLQVGDTNDAFNKVTVSVESVKTDSLGIDAINIEKSTDAGAAIQTIKDAINQVSTNRGNLGALQNRLEYAINNLDVTAENMTSANSRIRDTDMAKEMMNYTKMNVLTQSAQAMLAQANQQPQSILQLLQ